MGTQVLAGTVGRFNILSIDGIKRPSKDNSFIVTQDTCMESETLPVKFDGAADGCLVKMKDVTFTVLKTKDY